MVSTTTRRRRRWPAALLAAAAVAAVAVTVVVVVRSGSGTAAVRTVTPAGPPDPLVVTVSLDRHVVHVGDRVHVSYSWSDGDGSLVDTNEVGTMAEKTIRNVACSAAAGTPHPSSGHGSFWWTAVQTFVGPPDRVNKVQVGYEVRTGGCAPIEDRTAAQTVTVLPSESR